MAATGRGDSSDAKLIMLLGLGLLQTAAGDKEEPLASSGGSV